jgi:hypothetical protein
MILINGSKARVKKSSFIRSSTIADMGDGTRIQQRIGATAADSGLGIIVAAAALL